jgi:hypothetical protein
MLVGAALLFSSTALAQEESSVGTVSEGSTPTEAAPSEPAPAPQAAAAPEEEERSVYYKKVQGWLWMEGFVGPSSYDPDQFTSLNLSGVSVQNAPKLNGPEYGFAVGLGLGGFWLGGFYRQANYDVYKLMKVGLDIQGIFRFIPYVHPMIRIDLFYSRTFGGNPYPTLTNTDVDGGGFTLGAGLRIPIIRWMSFSATFDWTMIGLSIRGDDPSGARFNSGVLGQQLGATFSLTFHFIGVRKN